MSTQGFIQVPGLLELFVKYSSSREILLRIAKVVDDFLLAGTSSTIQAFHKAIANIFVVGTFVIDRDLVFNRLHIHRETSGSLILNMQEYVDKILPIPLAKGRRRKSREKCTPQELTAYQALAGSLNFLGHGILPQAAFAASNPQQSVGRLHVSNLITANQVLTELRSLSPILTFRSPTSL